MWRLTFFDRRSLNRYLVRQTKAEKPAVGNIDLDFLHQPPLGANPEQIANKQHLEQHHRIDRRPAIVLTVQVLGRFADEIKPDVLVEQAKQVVFRDQLLQRHHLQFRLSRVGRLEHANIIKN